MTRADEARGERIREALADCLSGAERTPSQRARVLQAVRGENGVRRRKLPTAVALALVMAMLAVGAVAAALLSMRDVVEREALPMALSNDADGEVNDTFTGEELAHIVAVAQENGFEVPDRIRRALESGEGYWEEETIMALAKAQFGPIPARWTLEQQYWFEETVVAIGFKDYNSRRVPGEGELSYGEALAKAEAYLAAEYGASGLHDPEAYAIACTYQVWPEDGVMRDPEWYFDFEALDLAHDEYHVTLDVAGEVIDAQASQRRAEDFQSIDDFYSYAYGSHYGWDQETFIAYRKDIENADASTGGAFLRALLMTQYVEAPDGALDREQAAEIALRESGIAGGYVICAVLIGAQPNPVWKISVAEEEFGGAMGATLLEIDCMTGEVLNTHVRSRDDYYIIHWVLQEVHDAVWKKPESVG